MANNTNSALFTGNATGDAVIKTVGDTSVANFSIAVNRSFTSKGVKQEETMFVRCALWGKGAEGVGPYIRKGGKLLVQGEIGLEQFTRNDGTAGASLTLRVNSVELLSPKPTGNGDAGEDPFAGDADLKDEPAF